MSVINQMLRDLESRKETNPQLAQPDFSKKPNSALRWLVRLLVFLLAAGLGYWFWLMPTEPLAQAPEPHSVVVPEPLSAPAPRLLVADETGETVPELSDAVAQAKHGSVPQVAAKIAEQPMAPEPEPARPSEPLTPPSLIHRVRRWHPNHRPPPARTPLWLRQNLLPNLRLRPKFSNIVYRKSKWPTTNWPRPDNSTKKVPIYRLSLITNWRYE